MTQQNAALVEQAAAAAASMQEQAESLTDVVSIFRLGHLAAVPAGAPGALASRPLRAIAAPLQVTRHVA